MRSVVVVLPASIWAAMPILRVRSIEYCRLGELTDFGFVTCCSFSNNASINYLCCDDENAPKLVSASGALKSAVITSGNVQRPCWPAPSCAPHLVCELHFPGPDRPPKFLRQAPVSAERLCASRQNQPASATPAKTADRAGLPAAPGKWRPRRAAPLLPDAAWRYQPPAAKSPADCWRDSWPKSVRKRHRQSVERQFSCLAP